MPLCHSGTAELQTERLLLRRFEYGDAAGMLRNWVASPAVQRGYGEPVYETAEAVRALLDTWVPQYQNSAFYRWAIIRKETNENIGQIAFCRVYTDVETAEIEYCIGESFWGSGYAAEALATVMRYSFEVPSFALLEAFHRVENPQSGRVLQKSGMKTVPNVRRFELKGELPIGDVCYAMTKEEYRMLTEKYG